MKQLGSLRGARERVTTDVSLTASDHGVPTVIRPASAGMDLVAWARANREALETWRRTHRALLFRGFAVSDAATFEAFVAATSYGEPLAYVDRTTPRANRGDRVYTSTVHPKDQEIRLHNEGTYWKRWAKKLFFACLVAAREGGATPLADVRRVYARIDPEVRARFVERGWSLVRHFHPHVGLPWQDVFQTNDRAEVEAYGRANDIRVTWRGDLLRTEQVRPAARYHPETGEPLWFNHAAFFHRTSLEPTIAAALEAEFGDALPYDTFYGDGRPIEDAVAAHLREAYEAEKIATPWETGDVLLLDNMSVAHGREPFDGPREVVVAMTEALDDADAPALTEHAG